MISEHRRLLRLAAALAGALALSGCNEDNSIESGLTIHLAELHATARAGEEPVEVTTTPGSPLVQGGYDATNLEKHPIRDVNGRVLALYRAYLVLDGLELVPCTDLATVPRRLLDALFPSAQAHAGHGSEPVGGRALDRPNVIDIVTQEEFVLPLGDAAVAPGRYCGLRVALVRLAGDAYGKPDYAPASTDDPTTAPEIPELAGRMFALRADYCAQTDGSGLCTQRVKVDIDDDGLTEPGTLTLDFARPLALNATQREAYLILGIAHGEWVRDVDVTRLTADGGERQKLLHNVTASLHVYDQGLGALPPNIAQ
jgi:hypothetical protein